MRENSRHCFPCDATAAVLTNAAWLDLAFLVVMVAGSYAVMAAAVYMTERLQGATRSLALRRAAWWPVYLPLGWPGSKPRD
jgi:hypothetical protein